MKELSKFRSHLPKKSGQCNEDNEGEQQEENSGVDIAEANVTNA